ncbi:hypothetical protein J6590_007937 [Homalodisca vitripennis]|nr:hypothetical protein J6590_007937 [Homalodisca vitripennis]
MTARCQQIRIARATYDKVATQVSVNSQQASTGQNSSTKCPEYSIRPRYNQVKVSHVSKCYHKSVSTASKRQRDRIPQLSVQSIAFVQDITSVNSQQASTGQNSSTKCPEYSIRPRYNQVKVSHVSKCYHKSVSTASKRQRDRIPQLSVQSIAFVQDITSKRQRDRIPQLSVQSIAFVQDTTRSKCQHVSKCYHKSVSTASKRNATEFLNLVSRV